MCMCFSVATRLYVLPLSMQYILISKKNDNAFRKKRQCMHCRFFSKFENISICMKSCKKYNLACFDDPKLQWPFNRMFFNCIEI